MLQAWPRNRLAPICTKPSATGAASGARPAGLDLRLPALYGSLHGVAVPGLRGALWVHAPSAAPEAALQLASGRCPSLFQVVGATAVPQPGLLHGFSFGVPPAGVGSFQAAAGSAFEPYTARVQVRAGNSHTLPASLHTITH